MKQFLRFQISGLSAVFWTIMFSFPYVNWEAVEGADAQFLTFVGVALIALALPLGTIIHQISITIASPFRQYRFLNKRKVLTDLEKMRASLEFDSSDKKNQFALVFAQSWRGNGKNQVEKCPDLDIEHIRAEISNRYSYYYVRIDNGLFAPIVGYGISEVLRSAGSSLLAPDPAFCPAIVTLGAVSFAGLMTAYIPAIFREVDDIERFLVRVLQKRYQDAYPL